MCVCERERKREKEGDSVCVCACEKGGHALSEWAGRVILNMKDFRVERKKDFIQKLQKIKAIDSIMVLVNFNDLCDETIIDEVFIILKLLKIKEISSDLYETTNPISCICFCWSKV